MHGPPVLDVVRRLAEVPGQHDARAARRLRGDDRDTTVVVQVAVIGAAPPSVATNGTTGCPAAVTSVSPAVRRRRTGAAGRRRAGAASRRAAPGRGRRRARCTAFALSGTRSSPDDVDGPPPVRAAGRRTGRCPGPVSRTGCGGTAAVEVRLRDDRRPCRRSASVSGAVRSGSLRRTRRAGTSRARTRAVPRVLMPVGRTGSGRGFRAGQQPAPYVGPLGRAGSRSTPCPRPSRRGGVGAPAARPPASHRAAGSPRPSGRCRRRSAAPPVRRPRRRKRASSISSLVCGLVSPPQNRRA